jgi:hypothetical protein
MLIIIYLLMWIVLLIWMVAPSTRLAGSQAVPAYGLGHLKQIKITTSIMVYILIVGLMPTLIEEIQ